MKLLKMILTLILPLTFSSCESVKDDARKTPIGSVMSGETTDTDSYIKRITQANKNIDKDVWRPESRDRF